MFRPNSSSRNLEGRGESLMDHGDNPSLARFGTMESEPADRTDLAGQL
jgi:hypothetical protein